jgi:hypothetical protein
MTRHFDVVVIGAGAAGLMCAIEAGKRGRRVAVIEHADQVGKKILISGGGRCNFTHTECAPENFLSANPHFTRSALARYTPADFVALVEKHGIPYHEKTRGQLFCDGSARDIVAMLESECRAAGVDIFILTRVDTVSRSSDFLVETISRGETRTFHSAALVVASGGLSVPKMGATGLGYALAKQFELALQPTRPALVPLLFGANDCKEYSQLAGVSTAVNISVASSHVGGASVHFEDKLLFTHRGLSGPAVLQISSYWQPSQALIVDLAPGKMVTQIFSDAKAPRTLASARHALQQFLPFRLASCWLEQHSPAGWSNSALADWEQMIHHWPLLPVGTEGYAKAEVTAGGVDTRQLSAKTMESLKVPGLFFIGEVVDVTGQLGGYNFQWAWASGAAAGRSV